MRGLKAALVDRARRDRVSVSALVRAAVEAYLRRGPQASTSPGPTVATTGVKISIRMTAGEAASLGEGARRAGLSRGAYLAALAVTPTGAVCAADGAAALTASCAQLATLARDLRPVASAARVRLGGGGASLPAAAGRRRAPGAPAPRDLGRPAGRVEATAA
ncbi:MAG: hypothetical protein MZW92_29640 [Comamonadaceae bacterium]|nr:hypothetical protein [Comamonadaceae bacterium]